MSIVATAPVELAPGRLYALGEIEHLEDRFTWVPPGERGFLPFNSYLLLEGTTALLVDPGVPKHAPVIVRQLRELLPPGATLDVFMTRSEMDCGGGIRLIGAEIPVRKLWGGGLVANPFAGLGWVAYSANADPDDDEMHPYFALGRCPVGQSIDLGNGRRFEVVQGPLKVLAAYWGYDSGTGTMFTADSFGHVVLRGAGDARVARTPAEAGDARTVARHLFHRFEWLLQADTAVTLELLDQAFTDREVRQIAPDHGGVIAGADTVRAQVRLVRDLIVERGGSLAPK